MKTRFWQLMSCTNFLYAFAEGGFRKPLETPSHYTLAHSKSVNSVSRSYYLFHHCFVQLLYQHSIYSRVIIIVLEYLPALANWLAPNALVYTTNIANSYYRATTVLGRHEQTVQSCPVVVKCCGCTLLLLRVYSITVTQFIQTEICCYVPYTN